MSLNLKAQKPETLKDVKSFTGTVQLDIFAKIHFSHL